MEYEHDSRTKILHIKLMKMFDNARSAQDPLKGSAAAAEDVHGRLLDILDSSITDSAEGSQSGESPISLLEFYMTYFPSPAEYIFESILETRPQLQDAYAGYLKQLAQEIREMLPASRDDLRPDTEEAMIRIVLQSKNMFPAPAAVAKLRELLRSSEGRSSKKALRQAEEYPAFCNRMLRDLMRKNPLLREAPAGDSGKKSSFTVLTERFRAGRKNGSLTEYQAAMLQEDCLEPLRKYEECEWRTKLHSKKGYDFFGNNSLVSSLRNVVFHMAFQLKLDPDTVSRILTKCLLQPDFNVKDHREVIYLWCLHRGIGYEDMIRDYFIPYRSPEFARYYHDLKFNDESFYKTDILYEQLDTRLARTYPTEAAARDAMMEHLKKLYLLEQNIRNFEPFRKRIEVSRYHLRDEIFRFIFHSDPVLALDKQYTDFTLRTPLPGVPGVRPVEDFCDFYNKYLEDRLERYLMPSGSYKDVYEKTVAAQLVQPLIDEKRMPKDHRARVREDILKPLSHFMNSPWSKPSLKQYHDFLGRDVLIYSIRNVLYHLAFALEMELEQVQQILDKCLLTPQWDPADHLEVIFRWCLKKHISYSDMIRTYIVPYHTTEFDRACQRLRQPLFLRSDPDSLRETFTEIQDPNRFDTEQQQEEAFLLYLQKIRKLEHIRRNSGWRPTESHLRRKTPRQVFSEYFDYFPGGEEADEDSDDFFYAYGDAAWPSRTDWKTRLEQLNQSRLDADAEEGADPVTEEPDEEDAGLPPEPTDEDGEPGGEDSSDNIRQKLEQLSNARDAYYSQNKEPLLPQNLLKDLFKDIEYKLSPIIKRKTGSVPISRKLLVTTIFIGYHCYEPQDREIDRKKLDRFTAECTEVLLSAGMYPFYERIPFELFLALCFLTPDPLAYFMSNWAHYLKTCT